VRWRLGLDDVFRPALCRVPWRVPWHALFAGLLIALFGFAFYAPALRATHGDWPAPLDDVFIHYDFAKATAHLHPFEWIAGQGYSSGETSALYPFLLAPGYLVGFRGLSLGVWAALLACGSLFVMMRALREMLAPDKRWWNRSVYYTRSRACPEWVSWLGSLMLVSVGVLDWTWFSGMEGALFCAALAVTLVYAKRAREAPPTRRRRAQWIVGGWGVALVGLRPEALVLVALLAVVVARRAFSQSATFALLRSAGPAVLAALTLLVANRFFTGDAPSAGALAKLLSYRPFLSDVDRATSAFVTLVHVGILIHRQLGHGSAFALVLPSLCLPAMLASRTRALAFVCVAGAVSWTLLASWNDTARFQNFRYFMPALALVLWGSALGVSALARSRALGLGGGIVALAGVGVAVSGVFEQIDFFANASGNIHDQQVEVGRRLATRMSSRASVLVGDAGAIPYVSGRHAIDAIGLGGYGGLPFARAATLGEGATVELIERIAPGDRPQFMALYPAWFEAITKSFGREVDRVSLDRNFICGGLSKGIYVADWSALADSADGPSAASEASGAVVDALDVADLVSERDHAYVSPEPFGGWTSLAIRTDEQGVQRFDAGRTIPESRFERFTLGRDAPFPATLLVRTDEGDAQVEAHVTRDGSVVDRASLARLGAANSGSWGAERATFAGALRRGDEVTLRVLRGTFRDFHLWVKTGG
jgi:hypothetical protein